MRARLLPALTACRSLRLLRAAYCVPLIACRSLRATYCVPLIACRLLRAGLVRTVQSFESLRCTMQHPEKKYESSQEQEKANGSDLPLHTLLRPEFGSAIISTCTREFGIRIRIVAHRRIGAPLNRTGRWIGRVGG